MTTISGVQPMEPAINWDLINHLHQQPHPLLSLRVDHEHDCCPWDGEVQLEARTAHHLLDMADVPRGQGYSSDVDARTYQLVAEVFGLRDRLGRLVSWHSRETGPGGMVGDFCNECGHVWPCDSRRMAEGTYRDDEDDGGES